MSRKLIRDIPVKMVVECKKWSPGKPVDVNVVRKVMYWVNGEYRATLGMIATTSRFTSNAIEQVHRLHEWRMKLKDHDAIVKWLEESVAAPYDRERTNR